MSGLQIFNAHPALYIGQQSNFDDPILKMRAVVGEDGQPKGVTTDLRHPLQHHRRPRALLRAARPAAGARLSPLAHRAELPGSRHRSPLALLLRLDLRHQRSRLSDREPRSTGMSGAISCRAGIRSAASAARSSTTSGSASTTAATTTCSRSSPISASSSSCCRSIFLTGLTMSPGMDAAFPWLLDVFGGRQTARTIHFICATLIVLFVARPRDHGADLGRLEQPPFDDHRPLRGHARKVMASDTMIGRRRFLTGALAAGGALALVGLRRPLAIADVPQGPRLGRHADRDDAALLPLADDARPRVHRGRHSAGLPRQRLDQSGRAGICGAGAERFRRLEAQGRRPGREPDGVLARRPPRHAVAHPDHAPRLRRGLELHRQVDRRPACARPRPGEDQAGDALHPLHLRRPAREDARRLRPLLRDATASRTPSTRRPSSPTS